MGIVIECRMISFNYVLDLMKRALTGLRLKYTEVLHEINDIFIADLLGEIPISGKKLAIRISIKGERLSAKPLQSFGEIPITTVTIDVLPPVGCVGKLAKKAEEVAKRIDEKFYSFLPKGGG